MTNPLFPRQHSRQRTCESCTGFNKKGMVPIFIAGSINSYPRHAPDSSRLRACWGGMTAFETTWFVQTQPRRMTHGQSPFDISPLRFRYEEDPFWKSSECCLTYVDLSYLRRVPDIATDSGIYMNPYVRVAYDSRTLGWLHVTRCVERLYSFVQKVLNYLVGMPYPNPRKLA